MQNCDFLSQNVTPRARELMLEHQSRIYKQTSSVVNLSLRDITPRQAES